jgi:TrpR family trp operon transcriptional repressor
LTHEEKDSLTTRFLIIQELLRAKMTQRDMASNLKVSIAKITRGSNAMKTIPPSLKKFLEENLK